MLLNSVKFSSVNYLTSIKSSKINFTSKPDSFEKKSSVKSFEFADDVSAKAKKEILAKTLEIANDDTAISPLGYGATGVVYRFSNLDGFGANGVVAKVSYTNDTNPLTGARQKVGNDFSDEIQFLKEVSSLGDKSQQYIGRLKLSDGRNVLLTTFVDGKNPDVKRNPINEKSLQSLLSTIQELDKKRILHRDLKKENIIVDSDSNAKLIDFGEAVRFNFLDEKRCDDGLNFPSFVLPTNLQNFEDTFLSPYYNELSSQDPKKADDFYKTYLRMKGQIVHKNAVADLAKFYEENKDVLTQEETDRIFDLMDYQQIMAKTLTYDSDNEAVVAVELMKNQVTYMSELAYKNEILLGNPLANITMKANAVICAKKMEAMVQKYLNRPNHPRVNEYLKYQLEIAKYRQEKIAGWLSGFVGWFCNCATTDINTQDEDKKKIINDSLKQDLEDFEVPNIAKNHYGKRLL